MVLGWLAAAKRSIIKRGACSGGGERASCRQLAAAAWRWRASGRWRFILAL